VEPIPPEAATQRWKRALGRFLDSRGFTLDEWQHAQASGHQAALVAAIQEILARLRLGENQADLLERDTLMEDWTPWLSARFGDQAGLLEETDPVGVAYGLRWCEILLGRPLDLEQLLDQPPESVIEWTRDLT
jgi:hypothetical protein